MKYTFFYISPRATLNETFTAEYNGELSRTTQVRPKSEFFSPKRDDEHPHPLSRRVAGFPPPPRKAREGTS